MKIILLMLSLSFLISCGYSIDEQILLGRSNINKGAYETARYHLEEVLKVDSTNGEANMLLGRLENQLGNYKQAKKYLDFAIGMNPNYAEAFKERAITLRKLKMPYEAIDDLTVLISLYKDNGQIYMERGNLYSEINKMDDACTDWQRAGQMGIGEAMRIYEKFCIKAEFE